MGLDIIEKIKSQFDDTETPSVRPQDFVEGFIIEEVIEGTAATQAITKSDQVRLALVGNAMPMIPFTWESEQRIKEVYYPGNSIPSVHVLGGKMGPVTIKGRLFDKRQPATSTKPLATAVTDAMELLCARGNLLHLKLGGWVRYGYLNKTKFNMRNLRSIEYELTFFIVSDTLPVQNPVLGGRDLPEADVASLKALNDRLQAQMQSYPSDFPKGPFEQISAAVNAVSKKVAVVTGLVDKLVSTVEQTSAGLNRAVGAVAALKSFIAKTNQRIGRISAEHDIRRATLHDALTYRGMRRAYPKLPRPSTTNAYKNVAHFATTQRMMAETQVYVVKIGSQLEAFIKSVSIRRHLVKDKETLMTIATLYYQDPEQWTKIRDHNKLTKTTLVAGSVLEIPL